MLSPDSILGPEMWWEPIMVRLAFPEDPAPSRLTKPQRREAIDLFDRGWNPHRMSYRSMAKNRPNWKLVEMGLATFDQGPVGSWLKTTCFMPVWTDPVL